MTSASFTLRLGIPEDAVAIIDAHRAAVRGTAAEYYQDAQAPLADPAPSVRSLL